MKFYIAARTTEAKIVREMITTLESRGHACTHDWTVAEGLTIERPYEDHIEEVRQFAEKDLNGAKGAELFIILGDRGGTGMYVELGAALANNAKVYAIGGHDDATIFHFHPLVKRMKTFEEVLADLENGF